MSIRKGVRVQGVNEHQERGEGSGVSEHRVGVRGWTRGQELV